MNTGDPTPIQKNMKLNLNTGRTAISLCAGILIGLSSHPALAAGAPVLVPQLLNTVDPQTNLHFSPDETLAVSMHREQLHIWDLTTGTLLRVLEQPGVTHYRDVTFAGGKQILSANFDFSLQAWDLETGTNTSVMPGRKYGGPGIVIAENTKRVFWLELDGYLRTSDLISPKAPGDTLTAQKPRAFGGTGPEGVSDALVQKPKPEATLYQISISGDGKRGLVQRGSTLQSVEIYNLDKGTLQCKIDPPKNNPALKAIRAFRLLPDGKRVLSTAFFEPALLFSADTCKALGQLEFSTEHVRSVSFTPDGRRALLSDSKNTKVIDLNSKKILFELPGTSDVSEVAISKSGLRGLLSAPSRFELWDLSTGSMERSLTTGKANISPVQAIAFSSTGKRIITASQEINDPLISVWDFQTLGLLGASPIAAGRSARVSLGSDGARAFSVSTFPRLLAQWDLSALSTARPEAFVPNAKSPLISSIFTQPFEAAELAANSEATRAITLDTHLNRPPGGGAPTLVRDLILWNGASPKTVTTFGTDERRRPLALSPDGKFAAIARFDTKSQHEVVHTWDTSSGLEISTIKIDSSYIWSAVFAPDNKTIAVADITPGSYGESRIRLYDASTGKLVRTLKGGFSAAYALTFSADQKTLAAGYGDRFARVFNVDTGALLSSKPLASHNKYVRSTAFSKDGRYLLTGSDDGIMRIHRLDQPASAVLISSGSDWLIYTDDGYFDASRRGGSLVAATSGLQSYRIDQFAVQKNRPDIILQRLGLGTPALMEHYRRRYERRLQKLGISDAGGDFAFEHAPQSKITRLETKDSRATLAFELTAKGKDLLRYNIFVNDVPLFGAVGKPVSGQKASISESFELGAGKNKIEVSTLDAEGNESLRDYRIADYKKQMPADLYYLGFGVSQYKNPAYNLGYPHKDVLDLGDVLRAGQGAFQNVHIATYINEQATTESVRRAKDFLKDAKVNDTVIVFIAGHGLREPGPLGDYYYATYETDAKRLPETAANFELIEDLLQGIAPRKKLLLMDTCESGDEEEAGDASNSTEFNSNTTGSRGLRARTTRALVLENRKPEKKSNLNVYISDRNRYIYNDLSRRSGAIVLSSSLGRELSWELDELQNGVFTEELLLALTSQAADQNSDGSVSIDELRDHISREVPKRTQEKQHPTIDRDNLEIDFRLPVLSEASAIVSRTSPNLLGALPQSLVASRGLPAQSANKPAGEAPPQTPLPRACGCRLPADSSESPSSINGLLFALIASIFYRMRRR